MKKLKANLENKKQFLTREEMKNIMGGVRECLCNSIRMTFPEAEERTCEKLCDGLENTN